MRVLAQPVVLDCPDAVIPELIREFGLRQTIPKKLRFALPVGVGDLHFVEQRKLHWAPRANQRSSRRAVQARAPAPPATRRKLVTRAMITKPASGSPWINTLPAKRAVARSSLPLSISNKVSALKLITASSGRGTLRLNWGFP